MTNMLDREETPSSKRCKPDISSDLDLVSTLVNPVNEKSVDFK